MFRFVGKFEFKRASIGIQKDGDNYRYSTNEETRRIANLLSTLKKLQSQGDEYKLTSVLQKLNITTPDQKTVFEYLIDAFSNLNEDEYNTGAEYPYYDTYLNEDFTGSLLNLQLGENPETKNIYVKGYLSEMYPTVNASDIDELKKEEYARWRRQKPTLETSFNDYFNNKYRNLQEKNTKIEILNALNTDPNSKASSFIEDISDNLAMSAFIADADSIDYDNFIPPEGIDEKKKKIYERMIKNERIRNTIKQKAQDTLNKLLNNKNL